MFQPDLFAGQPPGQPTDRSAVRRALDVAGILARLSAVCERPRYNFMVMNLIAQASARTGAAGPFVREGARHVPIRDWLSDAMVPVARRDPQRVAIAGKVRAEFEAKGVLPADPGEAERMVDAEVCRRVRRSGRSSVSRAVSGLVGAGLVRRHYQGYRVDHHNRGAQRQAVYTITEETRRALAGAR